MIELRPIIYVVGRILIVLALLMLAPAAIDLQAASGNGGDFLQSAVITGGLGVMVSLATLNGLGRGLDSRQAYILTLAIWTVVPLFAAFPFMLGAPNLGFTDAYFESVSGITTTGASVIVGLEELPPGINLWRGMLNWLGGLGIAFIAMIFLPVMRMGGMQFFRTEGFDTFGKALPRATDIARQLALVYFGLTVVCGLTFAAIGMTPLHATVHAMAAIATGGFSPLDGSFTVYAGAGEYFGALFMLLGSLPYVRYVQLVNGSVRPLWTDSQVHTYLRWITYAVLGVTVWRVFTSDMTFEPAFRESLFNLVSIMSSTGFFSGSFGSWGGFMMVVAFVIGIIGACSGSSAAGLSVFRVQIVAAAIGVRLQQIAHPNRIALVKYERRNVEDDVISGVILFVTGFIVLLGVMSVAMTFFRVDTISAIFAVWTTLANVGYGFGPMVQATGTFVSFPDPAKWIMIVAMLMGRLGLLAILVVVLPQFWRR